MCAAASTQDTGYLERKVVEIKDRPSGPAWCACAGWVETPGHTAADPLQAGGTRDDARVGRGLTAAPWAG